MKVYGEVEVNFYLFLTWAVDRDTGIKNRPGDVNTKFKAEIGLLGQWLVGGGDISTVL